MKRYKIVLMVASGMAILPVAGYLGLLLVFGLINVIGESMVSEITVGRAQKLFQEAGGIDAVNRDAQILIAQCESKDSEFFFLYPEDYKDTLAISRLFSICENYSGIPYSGTSLAFNREGGGHLEFKFGNHYSMKWIYIFDTKATITLNPSYKWIELMPNIFFSN